MTGRDAHGRFTQGNDRASDAPYRERFPVFPHPGAMHLDS